MRNVVKPVFFTLVVSALHFGYDLTASSFLKPFCAVNESVFQHLKIVFWGWLLVSLVEYSFRGKRVRTSLPFIFSRLLSAVVLPWFVVLMWYLVPALFGKVGYPRFELFWGIACVFIPGIVASVTEQDFAQRSFSRASMLIIMLLLAASIVLFIRFSYVLPWIDLFADPLSK